MITVVVTNLTAATVDIPDIYTEVGPVGSANVSATFTRSMAQLDSMQGLKALVAAGTVSVGLTASTDNVDIMSIPIEQHGTSGTAAAGSAATSNVAVTFPKAYPVGVTPKIVASLDVSLGTTAAGYVNVLSVTNTGFTARIVVVTTGTGTVAANWVSLA